MDIKKFFATDENLERDGVWVDIGKGASLLVARVGNTRHMEVMRRLVDPIKRSVRNQTVPDDKLEAITIEAIAEAVLIGWKGITEDVEIEEDSVKGMTTKDVPYSKAKAIEYLQNKDFRKLVLEIAEERETFRRQAIEDGAKN